MDYNITYRQKDKGWQFIISYKVNGKWKQKSKQGFKSKKAAKPIADTMLSDLKKQYLSLGTLKLYNDDITLLELSTSYFKHVKLYKENNTIKGYKNAYSAFKELENYKVKDIKGINIQDCVDSLLNNGLKVETIKTYLRRISLQFKYYIETYNSIYTNPTINIKLPTDKKVSNKKALTKKELDTLLKKMVDNKFYMVVYIAINTGLRCGEILGLTWDDIDYNKKFLKVNKQWKILKNGKGGFGELKTKNSNRIVPITNSFINELKKYKENNPISIDNRIAPFHNSSIEKYLNPELKKHGGVTMHELRHSYATLLVANGVDFKTVANILGHDVEQTYKTYSHVTSDMFDYASKTLEKIF